MDRIPYKGDAYNTVHHVAWVLSFESGIIEILRRFREVPAEAKNHFRHPKFPENSLGIPQKV
jgi:hypothetical protein